MRFPLPVPPKLAAVAVLVFALAACQSGSNPRPVPSVPQIANQLKCAQGDHSFTDQQVGWGFCYPDTWRYTEKAQATDSPSGVDLTFDITCISNCKPACATPSAGQEAAPCTIEAGLFGYMIISTDERSGAGDLETWLVSNMPSASADAPISWGNAIEAYRLKDGRRVALTAHSVVILDLHASPLDLEGEMSSRLATWKFSY